MWKASRTVVRWLLESSLGVWKNTYWYAPLGYFSSSEEVQ